MAVRRGRCGRSSAPGSRRLRPRRCRPHRRLRSGRARRAPGRGARVATSCRVSGALRETMRPRASRGAPARSSRRGRGAADQARGRVRRVQRPSRQRRGRAPTAEAGWSVASTRLPGARIPRRARAAHFRRCAARRRRRRRRGRAADPIASPLAIEPRTTSPTWPSVATCRVAPGLVLVGAVVVVMKNNSFRLTWTLLSDLLIRTVASNLGGVKSCTTSPSRPSTTSR